MAGTGRGAEVALNDLPILEAEGVTYEVGPRRLLEDVNLRVKPGELFGIIGPNGAGKTTLIRVLAGLLPPSRGEVRLRGRPMGQLGPRERAREVAYLSQRPGMPFGFRVYDVVAMGRYPHKGRLERWTDEDRRIVEEALECTGVFPLRDRELLTLSGGELQRVFFARALAQAPRLLLLDEPTTHLDVRYQLELLELIRSLCRRRGLTVVIALHDLTSALHYCDSLVVLKQGRAAACGPSGEVLNDRLLEEVFGVEARVTRSSDGRPQVEVIGLPFPYVSSSQGATEHDRARGVGG